MKRLVNYGAEFADEAGFQLLETVLASITPDCLSELILRLSAKERILLAMVYVEGLALVETANVLGISSQSATQTFLGISRQLFEWYRMDNAVDALFLLRKAEIPLKYIPDLCSI